MAVVVAGVAGLASAVVLRRLGWEVRVFEERPQSDAGAGSGLDLWPNAQRALTTLGVQEVSMGEVGLSLVDNQDGEVAAMSAEPQG